MPFLREKTGRWSPEKIAAFVLVVVPALWLLGRALAGDLGVKAPRPPGALGDLGPRPAVEAMWFVGRWAVRFLLAALAVTPAMRLFSWPRLTNARRTIGVAAFAYALLHFFLYVVDQNYRLGVVASEIALRLYLTIGFLGLLGLIALGSTSTDAAIRRLGARWKTLHRAAYVIAVLAIVHFAMQKKLDIYEPTLMMGFLIWLLAWRVLQRRQRGTSFVWLLVLAVFAALATALFEAGWYGALTGVSAVRVLQANLMLDVALRPAVWVLIAGVSVAVAGAVAQRLWPRESARAKLRPAA